VSQGIYSEFGNADVFFPPLTHTPSTIQSLDTASLIEVKTTVEPPTKASIVIVESRRSCSSTSPTICKSSKEPFGRLLTTSAA
jgi:hypothetical protein